MPNIADEVTIFVISAGNNPNYDACLMAIHSQSCVMRDGVRVEEIRNVAPMSRAFQEMISRCKTRYYVQVDHVDDKFIVSIHGLRASITAKAREIR